MSESVWDYPRPPALRVLETSHPPAIYVPRADVASGCIQAAAGRSFCEWKGIATYFDVVGGERREERAAWAYPDGPFKGPAGSADW